MWMAQYHIHIHIHPISPPDQKRAAVKIFQPVSQKKIESSLKDANLLRPAIVTKIGYIGSYQTFPAQKRPQCHSHTETDTHSLSPPSLNAVSIHLHRVSETLALNRAAAPTVPLTLLPIPFLRDLVEAEIGHLLVR